MKNKLAFLSSNTYDVSYSIVDEEGNQLGSGTITDDVAAGQSKDITIDLSSLNSQLIKRSLSISVPSSARRQPGPMPAMWWRKRNCP